MNTDLGLEYCIAPPGWTPDLPNPFSEDGSYVGWTCFEIADDLDRTFMHGRAASGLFHMRFGPNVDRLHARLAALLQYERAHGRRVIIACPSEARAHGMIDRALAQHSECGHFFREELRWLVHSTDLLAWKSIRQCGGLRSLARLQREGHLIDPLGIKELKEPADYAGYIMLGQPGYVGPEHVVASRKRGEIFTEEDVPYQPGVRLYFDGYRIIDDGLAVFDGIHAIKIHDHLPLEPYLIASVTALDLDPESRVAEWTPRTFLEAADQDSFETVLGVAQ